MTRVFSFLSAGSIMYRPVFEPVDERPAGAFGHDSDPLLLLKCAKKATPNGVARFLSDLYTKDAVSLYKIKTRHSGAPKLSTRRKAPVRF